MTISLRKNYRSKVLGLMLPMCFVPMLVTSLALGKSTSKPNTTAPTLTQSLLIRFESKVGAEKTLEDLLKSSEAAISKEQETKQWFVLKMDSNHFGMFHSFETDADRKTHLDGSEAMKLVKAKDAFAKAPTMEEAEILAAKTAKAGNKTLIKKALIVVLEASSGKEAEVEQFLKSALPLVNKEPKTLYWYAIKLSANTYAIVDTFADDAGREAHLQGKVSEALKIKSSALFQKDPVIEKVDVIAFKS